MTTDPTKGDAPLPDPPNDLRHGEVALRLDHIDPGDPSRRFVPWYHFRILNPAGEDIGHINFRVGDVESVRYVGHIGFGVDEPHRGHGYAQKACLALVPCIRQFFDTVVLTCNPDNQASRRTMERLGATFIEEVAVPPEERQNVRGATAKRRYAWSP